MMCLRAENKSLMEKMDWIESIVKNNRKARQRMIHKPQGKSLWKCLNTTLAGNVPKKEVRIQQKVRLQQEAHVEREYTDSYTLPQIDVTTQDGVLIKVDLVNGAQVSQEDATREWLQCEPQSS
eukprot:Gb_35157 [translate_table: standard]